MSKNLIIKRIFQGSLRYLDLDGHDLPSLLFAANPDVLCGDNFNFFSFEDDLHAIHADPFELEKLACLQFTFDESDEEEVCGCLGKVRGWGQGVEGPGMLVDWKG